MEPILFNTEMVQAILDGRKTVTRRVVKPKYDNTHFMLRTDKYGTEFVEMQNNVEGETFGTREDGTNWRKIIGYIRPKPPYKVGEILYVQETWLAHTIRPLHLSLKYRADDKVKENVEFCKERFEKFKKFANKNGWQSPYFMPKEAARIFLRVTDVRVERLRDITSIGVKQEGCDIWTDFAFIWTSTLKKDDMNKYGWNANPWVWVIEFERCEKPQEVQE